MRFIETCVWLLEGGINKVPARFSCFVSCFSAFSGIFFSPPFACPNNSWRIALRRLYMEHTMNIDIKLMLAVKSLEETESLPQHKNIRWSNWKCVLPVSCAANCWGWILEDPGENTSSLPSLELQDNWGLPHYMWREAVASVTCAIGDQIDLVFTWI